MTGKLQEASWNRKAEDSTVFDLKATVLNIFTKAGVGMSALKMTQKSDATYSVCLEIAHRSGKHLATVGILSRNTLKMLDIDQEVCHASIDWDYLCKLSAKYETLYSPLEKTQPVRRDLALLLDAATQFAAVEACARKAVENCCATCACLMSMKERTFPRARNHMLWHSLSRMRRTPSRTNRSTA